MKKHKQDTKALTPPQAAPFLKVTPRMVQNYIEHGKNGHKLKATKINERCHLIEQRDLDEFKKLTGF